MKPHILIVDDDNRILELLKKFFEQHQFLVSTSSSALEAESLIGYFIYDLIILDVMLPGITGFDFASKITAAGNLIPIMMLTALTEPDNRVKGLESGASDYLTKPFEPRELLLRVRNLIDNYHQRQKNLHIVYFGNNYYDFHHQEFVKKNQVISLSPTEQKLLEILIQQNGQTISREQLSEQISQLCPRSIDVQIARIRSKIEDNPKSPKYLKTIRNQGYVLYT